MRAGAAVTRRRAHSSPSGPSSLIGQLRPAADRVLWYHTVLDWIEQWVKPDRAEFNRQLTAASTSGH
jgi:hypothetical protein